MCPVFAFGFIKYPGKYCEFVAFSNNSAIEVAKEGTHGRVQHGIQVYCNLYKRVGNTLVVAWGEDPSGVAPQSLRPGPQSRMVATFDLEGPPPKNNALKVCGKTVSDRHLSIKPSTS